MRTNAPSRADCWPKQGRNTPLARQVWGTTAWHVEPLVVELNRVEVSWTLLVYAHHVCSNACIYDSTGQSDTLSLLNFVSDGIRVWGTRYGSNFAVCDSGIQLTIVERLEGACMIGLP
jgi:hypothetical protein